MAFRVCHCLALVLLSFLPLGMAMDSIGQYCGGNSYKGGQVASNINTVLADLVSKASIGGFATSTTGKGSNVIYGLAQCRGDVAASDCAACLADAAKQLPAVCPRQTDARIWYDYCFMRYDNAGFVGQADTDAGVIYVNVQGAADPKAFEKEVGKVVGKATAQASAEGSAGLGRNKDQFTPFVTIYALAQCTEDLQPLTCAQCLSTAVSKFPDYCGSQQGCQINYSSCRVRYEVYPFYFPLDGSAGGRATTDMSRYTRIVVHP